MSRLAKDLRIALFSTFRELDECDPSKLYHEAQAMVHTNRKLKREKPDVPAKTGPMCDVSEDESPFWGLNESGFQ